MDISPKDHKLKLLFALGGCVVLTIICVLMFGFEVNGTGMDKQSKKIGFINIGYINEAGWSKAHYEGLKAACEEFGMTLMVREHVLENTGQCPVEVKELIDDLAGMIFMASYNYPIEAQDLIEANKKIEFAANSSEVHARNMTSYFARMYQGRYLAGALAGMRTKTNVIGYVAAMANSEVCRGIDAFTLGVQRTNPKAKVVVKWTGDWRADEAEKEAAQKLVNVAKADVLTYHQDKATVCEVAEEMGVEYIAYNMVLDTKSERYLTSIICNWNVFYKKMLQLYLKGELNTVKNFWLGIKQDVVDLTDYSSAVTQEQRVVLGNLRQELLFEKQIFSGVIYDNAGNLRCGEGEAISENVLLEKINWLVRGVEILE